MSSQHKNENDLTDVDAEIEVVFAQVKSEYARKLPSKLADLKRVLDSAQACSDDEELFTHALNEVHRTKGTLGSYGFPTLAQQVACIELLLKQINDSAPPAARSSLWTQINTQVTEILAEAIQQAKTP